MPDSERVIKEFEAFVNGNCPSDFKHICHIEIMKNVLALLKEQENTIDTLNTVIFGYETGAIKHQEAVEPIPPKDESDLWRCGNCNHQLFRCTHQRYCEMCGQAVKWE